jgi:hypothetical protein
VIAALFVETDGVYYGLPNVDPWDRERDARLYSGPHRVIAHPPCDRWCQMAPVNQARYGHKIGDDEGCFESALASVRKYGGVLEHPAYSLAWPAFDLPRPFERSGWVRGFCGGWSAHIEQSNYGHRARKGTWLYVFGVDPSSLKWNKGPVPRAWVSTDRPRAELAALGIDQLSKSEAKKTPEEFRDLLLSIVK